MPVNHPRFPLQLSIVTSTSGAVTLSEHTLALIKNLKEDDDLFVITEKSGTLNELLLAAPGAYNLLVLPNGKGEMLLPVAKEIHRRTIVLCNSMNIMQYSMQVQAAAFIPQPGLVAPGGWLTGFAHHAALYYMQQLNPHIINDPYAFWRLPANGAVAQTLFDYLCAYEHLFAGLWLTPGVSEKAEE